MGDKRSGNTNPKSKIYTREFLQTFEYFCSLLNLYSFLSYLYTIYYVIVYKNYSNTICSTITSIIHIEKYNKSKINEYISFDKETG